MKSTVLRYTVLRLMIFFGCLIVAWLVGLRNDPALLLLVSAAVSVVLSFFLLRRDRDAMSEGIADKVEQRRRARMDGVRGADEDDEDAEIEHDHRAP